MPNRLFDHLDLRVSNLAEARKFYDAWLPALGLTEIDPSDDQVGYVMPGVKGNSPFVWLNEEPGHRGGANRVAFWADTEDEVDGWAKSSRRPGRCGSKARNIATITRRAITPCFSRMPTATSGKSAAGRRGCASAARKSLGPPVAPRSR